MKKYILIFILLPFFFACEKKVNLKLEEMPPTIVVESIISSDAQESFVKLSWSKGLTSSNGHNDKLISDAQVIVVDPQGNDIIFTPDASKVYRTTTPALQTGIYRLKIDKDSHHVLATKQMPRAVVLNDFDIKEIRHDEWRDYELELFFQDDPNQKDYYMITYTQTSSGHEWREDYLRPVLFSDTDYDTQAQRYKMSYYGYFPDNTPTRVKMRLYHIDKQVFDYFETLDKLGDMGFGSSPFTTSVPGNPNSVIENGIGYFIAAPVSRITKEFSFGD